MKTQIILIVSAIFFLSGCTFENQKTPEFTILNGATVFDGTGKIIKQGVIVINAGKIHSIGNRELNIPDDSEIIDVTGKFIAPGLVDAHVHFCQTGFFDGRPDVLDITDSIDYVQLQTYLQNNPDRYYEAYLRAGVTAVYDVGGYLWSLKFQSEAENNLNAPHVAATGPLLTHVPDAYLTSINTPGQKVLFNLSSPDFGQLTVRQNTSLGSTGIKIWQINLNDPVFMESLRAVAVEVENQGNKLIVHATDLDQAKEALRLGAKLLVHSVDDQPIDEEFIRLAKEAQSIYCPTLIVNRGYYNAFKSLKNGFEVTDVNGIVDSETKDLLMSANKFFQYLPNPEGYEELLFNYEEYLNDIEKIMYNNLKSLHEAGIPIAVSTDAGNPGTLHGISIYDEMEAMQNAGIPAEDIIVMASKNGALAMGRFDDFGTIEKGKMADLIIMDKDPSKDISNVRSISHVMRGGLLRPVNEPFEKTANKR